MPSSRRTSQLRGEKLSVKKSKRIPIMKVCLIGDGGVGKTALRENYVGSSFTDSYLPTIGAEFATKTEIMDSYTGKFLIWDLAGQPRFSVVREGYYKGARGLLLVFDVTRTDSFESAPNWLSEAWKHVDQGRSIPIILIGNKIDIRDDESLRAKNERSLSEATPMIATEQGHMLAREIDNLTPENAPPIEYYETSAKTGENVEKAFQNLGKLILTQVRL